MGGPRIRSGQLGEEKSPLPLPWIKLWIVQSVAQNNTKKKSARKLRTMQLHKQLCYSYTEGGVPACKTNILLSGAFSHNSYSNRRPRLSHVYTETSLTIKIRKQISFKWRESIIGVSCNTVTAAEILRKFTLIFPRHAGRPVNQTGLLTISFFFTSANLRLCKKQLA
jgi:hypothetical protein